MDTLTDLCRNCFLDWVPFLLKNTWRTQLPFLGNEPVLQDDCKQFDSGGRTLIIGNKKSGGFLDKRSGELTVPYLV